MTNDQPTGETVLFHREDMFYPIQLSGLKPSAVEAADHAALNPGTLRITDLAGNVIWPEGASTAASAIRTASPSDGGEGA